MNAYLRANKVYYMTFLIGFNRYVSPTEQFIDESSNEINEWTQQTVSPFVCTSTSPLSLSTMKTNILPKITIPSDTSCKA